jgi:hypothetical protein
MQVMTKLPPRTGDDDAMHEWLEEKLFDQAVAEVDEVNARQEQMSGEELRQERLEVAIRLARRRRRGTAARDLSSPYALPPPAQARAGAEVPRAAAPAR